MCLILVSYFMASLSFIPLKGVSLFTMNGTVLSVWKWNHRQEGDMKNEMAHVQMHTHVHLHEK